MLFILSGIILYLGLVFVKSKKLSYLISIYMFIIFAFNTANADYHNYTKKFAESISAPHGNKNIEIGFFYLSKLTYYLGGNYSTLLLCISLSGITLIYIFIKSHTKVVSLVLVLYLIFPFFLDVVQIRSFIAMVLFLYACKDLMNVKHKLPIKAIFLILLATSFHYSAILYMPVIFIKTKWSFNKILIIYLPLVFIGCLLTYGGLGKNILYFIMPSSKAVQYVESRTGFGWSLYLYIHIIILTFLLYSNKIYNYNKKNVDNDNTKNKHYIENVIKINIIMSYIIIFYAYNVQFFRLYRATFLLNYIVFAVVLDSFNQSNKVYYRYFLFGVIGIIGLSLIIFFPSLDRTVIPILTNNSFFLP